MKRSVFFTLVSGLYIFGSQGSYAILDSNNNGLSDLWEKHFNSGNLFTNFDSQADPDGDGWTNAQEAAAGTHPLDSNPPSGILRPDTVHTPETWADADGDGILEHTPEAITLTWVMTPGKQYTVVCSPDLTGGSWFPVGESFIGNGNEVEIGLPFTQSGGENPNTYFWRVSVADIDSDSDGLTNHEEFLAGTNPTITDTDRDSLSDHAELIANTDPLQADADGDGWTDPQEIAAGTDSRNQDTDGDGIPDSIDSQPLSSNFAFPDADGDGISDGDDADPTNPRGPTPLITSETASGNPFSNLIKDETARFLVTVSNPSGPAPLASNLTFFLNGTVETATISAIGSSGTSTQRFLLIWNAKTSASYPTRTLQNLTLRFRDAQQATTWLNLARIDIAEWEGYIAMVPVPQTETDGNNTSLEIESHINGKRYSDSFGGSSSPREVYYRGPRSVGVRDEDSHAPLTTFQIPAGIKSPLFFTRFLATGISNTSTIDAGDFSSFPHNCAWYFNYTSAPLRYDWDGIVTEVAPYSTGFQEYGAAWGNSSIAVDWLTNPVFAVSRSTWHHEWPFRGTFDRQIYPAYPITTNQPTGSVRTFGHRLFSRLPASITPHLAGTLEVPGLLIHPFAIEKEGALFLVPSETYQKILCKVDPAAEEWTTGIRLHLGQKNTDYTGENMPPQQGINLYQVESNSPVPVGLDADGNLLLTPTQNATLYRKITSSEGLPLFLKRTSAADKSHTLKIQVHSKFEADTVTTVAEMDLTPVEIDYIDPDDETWQIVAADGHVYLHDKSVKVRIGIRGIEMSKNQLHNSEFGEILLKSSFTGAGFQETVLSVIDPVCEVVTETGYTEIRITIPEIDRKRLNLLPSSGEADLTVYSILDYVSDGESNLSDSQAFIDAMNNGLMGQPAGYAHNKTPTDLSSLVPHSNPDGTFLQSAGCEVLNISFQSASKPTQIMNQGEIFYFSGHGFPGVRATGPTFTVSDTQSLNGSDLKQYWNDDLNLVVIAGCSVVNVNNWNPNPAYFSATFGPDAGYYPGEFMNLSGPRFILGYGSSAPRDTQNADGIASTFTSEYLQNTADPFSAWRTANDNSNGRNATAIERNVKFGYFERVQFFGVTVDYVWSTKNFNEW